ncbi:YitT family protein [Miniphocaeibacter massiliensis]|uniref:YitT family protein n=1 Tax=Miniphocaeibacter massiliensis TaxID=2041841 RepID=UPI001F5DE236|nr:YitT family protein [Miniphocaeibacter massiliensis]
MFKFRETFKKLNVFFIILLGTCILAFGMHNIHSRTNVTEGGIFGLVLLFENVFGFKPWIVNPLLDGICYYLGYKYLGKSFLKYSIIASISLAIFHKIFEITPYILPDFSNTPLVAAILGGVFIGVGAGIIVAICGVAAGGDDALALVINKKAKLSLSKAYILTDVTVLLASLVYIPVDKIMYSFITVTISSSLIGVIESSPAANLIYSK